MSVVVGAVSLCTFVPGILAIILAQWELSRVASGEAPTAGRGWAQTGRTLGIVALVMGVLFAFAVWG